MSARGKGFFMVGVWHVALVACLLYWIYLAALSWPVGAQPVLVALDPVDVGSSVLLLFFTLMSFINTFTLDYKLAVKLTTLEKLGETGR